MWQYEQLTGRFTHDVELLGVGYSGEGPGKNAPQMQNVQNVGPIPCGKYRIGLPFESSTKGPLAMTLTPLPGTNDFGRDGFMIHGDSIKHPGWASHGCIILAHNLREQVAKAVVLQDNELEVISGAPDSNRDDTAQVSAV